MTGESNYFLHPDSVQVFDYPTRRQQRYQYNSWFLNDNIAIHRRVTLNAGLRFDRYSSWLPAQGNPGTGPYATPLLYPENHNFPSYNSWSPRLSVIYDVTGTSRVALKASYGRYGASGSWVSASSGPVAGSVNPAAPRISTYTRWNGVIPYVPVPANLTSVTGGAGNLSIDPNTKPFVEEEFSGGVDLGLSREVVLRLNAVRKTDSNLSQTINTALPYGAYTDVRTAVDPGRDNVAGTADDGVVTVYSVPRTYPTFGTVATLYTNGIRQDHYSAFEATLNKRHSAGWSALVSYSLDRHTWENNAAQNPNETLYLFSIPETNQQVHLNGLYDRLPWGLKVSGTYTVQSGAYFPRVVQARDALNTLVNVTVEGHAGRYDWVRLHESPGCEDRAGGQALDRGHARRLQHAELERGAQPGQYQRHELPETAAHWHGRSHRGSDSRAAHFPDQRALRVLMSGRCSRETIQLGGEMKRVVLLLALLLTGPVRSFAQTTDVGVDDPAKPPRWFATFSIIAFDPATKDFGVAVQSHAFTAGAAVPYAIAGVGAVATQAAANRLYGPKAIELLKQGLSPAEVIKRITDEDPGRDTRQVAVIDAKGRSAVYTGKHVIDRNSDTTDPIHLGGFAGHITGANFSVQGNTLASEDVLKNMARAYEQGKGTMAERLMDALDGGQAAGGDTRGMQSAGILVVRPVPPGSTVVNDRIVDLRVDDAVDPFKELRRLLNINLGTPRKLTEHAAALAGAGKFDEAIAEQKRALEIQPNSDTLHYALAQRYAEAALPMQAIVPLREAIRLHPNLARQAATDPIFSKMRDMAEFKRLIIVGGAKGGG